MAILEVGEGVAHVLLDGAASEGLHKVKHLVCRLNKIILLGITYYTDIDRDSHEISRFGGLPRVIFSQRIILNIVPRENMTILAPPTHDISSVPVELCYIRWSKLKISSKFYVLYDYHELW